MWDTDIANSEILQHYNYFFQHVFDTPDPDLFSQQVIASPIGPIFFQGFLNYTAHLNRAPNGWWLNWLKSAVATAGAFVPGYLGAATGPQQDPKAESLVGATHSICQL